MHSLSLLVWKDASNVPDAFLNHRNSFQIQSCYIYTFTQLSQIFLKPCSTFPYILDAFFTSTLQYLQTYLFLSQFFQNISLSGVFGIIQNFVNHSQSCLDSKPLQGIVYSQVVKFSYMLYSFWYPVSYIRCRLYRRIDGWLCLWPSWMDFRRAGKVSFRTHMHT